MKNIFFTNRFLVLLAICFIVFQGCDNKDNNSGGSAPDGKAAKVNLHIKEAMEVYYLWNDDLPALSPSKYSDPYRYFQDMRNPQDPWSTLTDDVDALNQRLNNTSTTSGIILGILRVVNGFDQVSVVKSSTPSIEKYGLIMMVYPGSPASEAGIKRGDIIMTIDNEGINDSNIKKLNGSSAVSLKLGKFTNTKVTEDRTVSVTPIITTLEPVVMHKVIGIGSHKIGYLVYNDFQLSSHRRLNEVFNDFHAQGITDLVLDLRYNLGGHLITCQYLSSIIVPRQAVTNNEIFLRYIRNENYQRYLSNRGVDDKDLFKLQYQYKDDFGTMRHDAISSGDLGLRRLYVLTTGQSASASEALIYALKPYMEVITIGSRTAGKYVGGALLSWTDSEINNWGIYLMMMRYTNKDGQPAELAGHAPVRAVNDNPLWWDLGDPNEAMLAKAISLITSGQTPTEQSSAGDTPDIYVVPEPNRPAGIVLPAEHLQ